MAAFDELPRGLILVSLLLFGGRLTLGLRFASTGRTPPGWHLSAGTLSATAVHSAMFVFAALFTARFQRLFLLWADQGVHLFASLLVQLPDLLFFLLRRQGRVGADCFHLRTGVLFNLAMLLGGLLGNAGDLPTGLLASSTAVRRRGRAGGSGHSGRLPEKGQSAKHKQSQRRGQSIRTRHGMPPDSETRETWKSCSAIEESCTEGQWLSAPSGHRLVGFRGSVLVFQGRRSFSFDPAASQAAA